MKKLTVALLVLLMYLPHQRDDERRTVIRHIELQEVVGIVPGRDAGIPLQAHTAQYGCKGARECGLPEEQQGGIHPVAVSDKLHRALFPILDIAGVLGYPDFFQGIAGKVFREAYP